MTSRTVTGQDGKTELARASVHSPPYVLPPSNEAFVEASPVPTHGMPERPLSPSRVAQEEEGAPQESSSPVEPHDVITEQPPQLDPLQLFLLPSPLDASWLPLYGVKQKDIDLLQALARSPHQGEDDKRIFLENTIYVCRSALDTGLLQGLEIFFQNINLVEKVKMLLEEEPKYCLRSPVRELAMHAIAKFSFVGTVLEGKRRSLIEACISKVFWLPPDEEMQERNRYYLLTLDAMDIMLEAMVFNSPSSNVAEELQHILEMLLDLTNSESTDVQERAIGRIGNLSCALATWEHWPHDLRVIQIPILGQLLGRLLGFQFSTGKTKYLASRAFYYLCQFIFHESRKMSHRTEFYREYLRLPVTFLQWCHYLTARIEALEYYLTPCERTYIVLAAIEAMQDSSTSGHQAARHFLKLAMRSPDLWLTDVPSIVKGIHECLEHTSLVSDVESLDTLLAVLAREFPRELVCSMLTSTEPYDSAMAEAALLMQQSVPGSTALVVWDRMYSQKNIKSKFWMELQERTHSQEQHNGELFSPTMLYAIIVYKVMLNPTDTQIVELLKESQMCPKLEFLSLVLTGLSAALENPERVDKARRLQFLLPDIVENLQHTNKGIRLKALQVLQNMVHYAERKKASSMALQLLEQLLPLFSDECIELREYSIFLFKQLVEAAVCWDKRRMKHKARRGVMPLLFHMNEQSESVAQLEKDRCRAEEYLDQSLPYLKDPQATVREMAVQFTGEPQFPGSLFGQLGPCLP
ncbi:protein MROH8 [Willisornis vidua]|uniref:Protein MROH8 n=1 Tax=Willisornis vidua TaxID=1566151 RepID=A0ABQ9CPV0_9PASS|nr:protein MROH8 [Willisornis vidua]